MNTEDRSVVYESLIAKKAGNINHNGTNQLPPNPLKLNKRNEITGNSPMQNQTKFYGSFGNSNQNHATNCTPKSNTNSTSTLSSIKQSEHLFETKIGNFINNEFQNYVDLPLNQDNLVAILNSFGVFDAEKKKKFLDLDDSDMRFTVKILTELETSSNWIEDLKHILLHSYLKKDPQRPNYRKICRDLRFRIESMNGLSIIFSPKKSSKNDSKKMDTEFPQPTNVPKINSNSTAYDKNPNTNTYKQKVLSKKSAVDHLSRCELLFEDFKIRQELNEYKLTSKASKELDNCTFKPKLSPYVEKIFNPDNKDVHKRLYQLSEVLKEKMKNKKEKIEILEEEKIKNITFKPSLSPYKPSTANLPRGAGQAIDRLRMGQEIRDFNKQKFENLGKVIKKSESNTQMKSPFSGNRSLSSSRSKQKNEKKELIINVEVTVGPGKTGRIPLHVGDDPIELTENFSRVHPLTGEQKLALRDILINYQKQKLTYQINLQEKKITYKQNRFYN